MSKRVQKMISSLLIGVALATTVPVQAQQVDYVGHWAEKEISTWIGRGILSGYEDGTLRPSNEVTRAEFAKMLVQVFGLNYAKAADYVDVSEGMWFKEDVELVTTAKMMHVEGNAFRPNEGVTREEAAYALATAYHIQKEGNYNFEDEENVADWAREAVEALALEGYIQGYEDGTFKPQGVLTRAEVVMMLDKITAEVIHESGTYENDVDGNLVINTPDVVLENVTVKGNLYLAEGIGEGDVVLDHVVVEGQVIVEGGGSHSVELIGTQLQSIIINKASGPVRLAGDEHSSMKNISVQSQVQLEGNIETIEVLTQQEVKLVDAKVNELKVVQEDAKLTLDKETVLQTLVADAKVEVSGKGVIKAANINADEVKIEGVQLDKKNIVISDTVEQQPIVNVPSTESSASSGSGGDYTSPSQPNPESVVKGSIKGTVTLGEEIASGAEVVLYKMISESNSVVVKQTKTDAIGNYTFKNVTPGFYRLEVRYQVGDTFYETSVSSFEVVKTAVTQQVIMEKKEATALVFKVIDEQGQPMQDAQVIAEATTEETNWGAMGETDASGIVVLSSKYTFPVGTQVSYTVQTDGYELVESMYTVEREGRNEIPVKLTELKVETEPEVKGSIEGTVKLGEEIASGAEVVLYKMVSESSSMVVEETKTDATGSYTFKDVTPGFYRLEVRYQVGDALYETYVEPFEVVKAAVTQQIIMEKKEATALVFKVIDEQGQPVQDAQVIAEATTEETNWGSMGETDASGIVVLSSKYTFPVDTQVSYIVEKKGYEDIEDIYTVQQEGRNEIQIVLKGIEAQVQ